jgi:tetratricopeptide (TPR) repeat protein
MGWRFAHSNAPESTRLTSIFILTSIVGIGINAMGDFPFQMPIAPIITWILIAILTGLYVMHFKDDALVGFNINFKIKPFVSLGIAASLFVALNYVVTDDLSRFRASAYMKYVMSYAAAGIFNDKVLDKLEEAHEIYPYNSRTSEYRGTVPVNYKGNRKLSLDSLIKMGEQALVYDPYAPNNLINLGGIYFRKAMLAEKLGESKVAIKYADKVLEIYHRLLPLAYFAPHTYSLAGFAYLIKEKSNKSIALFDKALELDSSYASALTGQALSIKALQMEGKSALDIDIMRGKASVSPFNRAEILKKLQKQQ